MAGAADLRVRPALVRRVRDRGGARRARRRVGRRRASRVPDLARDRRAARDRRPLVPPDGAGLRELRRRLHRRQGEPGPAAEPRRGGRAPDRLHPHRRGLGCGRRARAHLGRDLAARPRADALARLRRADRGREPARCRGGGDPVRDPDLRVRRVDLRADRRRARPSARPARARRRSCRIRCAAGRRRRHRVRRPARVRLGLDGADGRRGDRERCQRVPTPARRATPRRRC